MSNLEGDFYRFYPRNQKTILVWFAGIDEPFMSENLAISTNCDVLSIRDSRNLWYVQGIAEHHKSHHDGVAWLTSMTASYDHIVFAGQSSGGYGALLFGQACKANLVIAFSPQTRNSWTGQCGMVPTTPLIDLRQIYKPDAQCCPVILNIGQSEADHEDSFFWDDIRQTAFLREMPYVTLMVHPFHNHNVSGLLKGQNRLYPLISSLISIYSV